MLPYNRMEALTDERIPLADRQWAERYLTAMPVKEALAKAPYLRGRLMADAEGRPVSPFYFRCSALNSETRQCGIYADRPRTCRGYPWYGGEVRSDAALPPTCSFRADLGEVPVAISPRRIP